MQKFKALSEEQAQMRLNQYGENSVPVQTPSIFKICLKQLNSPIIYLLIVAATISFLTNSFSDGIVITFIIVINTILGFLNEYSANRTFEKLSSFISSTVTVIREGTSKVIERTLLVPDDVIELKLGDIVPADAYVLEAENLYVDESSLTGESNLLAKETNLQEDKNFTQGILYSGSYVKSGRCFARVYATGLQSRFGSISNLSINTKKKTEYEENLKNLSVIFLITSIVFLVIIFLVHIITKRYESTSSLLLFTIAVAITIIPEALPVLSAITLSSCARRLGKKGVIVKRATAIEDLGNLDIICTDKTGTLTKNQMVVENALTKNLEELKEFTLQSSIGSTDPIDLALLNYINEETKEVDFKVYEDIPFNPKDRLSGRKFKDFTIWKGASESIISMCSNVEDKESIMKEIEDNSLKGYRAISFCVEKAKNRNKKEYVGTYLLFDEVKEDAGEVISHAKTKGLQIKVITGDSTPVGFFVGKKVGLIDDYDQVIEASHLSWNDQRALTQEIMDHVIFTRADPEQKYAIIKVLEERHHVGYLGDGINDAPSLKLSNVGIVVDSATDIAKSTADIIITKKSLEVIIDGIVEGRKAFENIDKYIKHTLIGNFGNFFTIGIISLFTSFLPMTATQILVNNLLIDIPSLALSTDTVDSIEIKKPKNHSTSNLIKMSILLGSVSSVYDFIFFFIFMRNPEVRIQSMWFIFSTLTELLILFSIRSRRTLLKSTKPSTPLIAFSIFSLLIAIGTGIFGLKAFEVVQLEPISLLLLIVLSLAYLYTTEILKLFYYNFLLKKAQ